MKNYNIYKNFLSIEDCDYLSNWIIDNKGLEMFKDANMKGNRLTTRYSKNFNFPEIAYKIQKDVIKKLNLNDFYYPDFQDGMVASCAMPGDTCFIHKDPIWKNNTKTLHCNIKLSESTGGNPIIEGEELFLKKGDMWSYPVSEVMHGSNLVTGTIPRTMWIFGFSITKKDYDRLF